MLVVIAIGLLLAAGLIALYRARMGAIPWTFLGIASAVILVGFLGEAFGEQAGMKIGSSSLIVILGTAIAGFFVVKPAWGLLLAAILCAVGTTLSHVAYAFAGLFYGDLATRIDEAPLALVPLALILATIGAATARDLPWPPRRLMLVSVIVIAFVPLTRIGERAEDLGAYLAYAAGALWLAGWVWLMYALSTRKAETLDR